MPAAAPPPCEARCRTETLCYPVRHGVSAQFGRFRSRSPTPSLNPKWSASPKCLFVTRWSWLLNFVPKGLVDIALLQCPAGRFALFVSPLFRANVPFGAFTAPSVPFARNGNGVKRVAVELCCRTTSRNDSGEAKLAASSVLNQGDQAAVLNGSCSAINLSRRASSTRTRTVDASC